MKKDKNQNNQELTVASSVYLSETPDDYSGFQMSEKVLERLDRTVSSAQVGLVSASALICKGPAICPFRTRCPIYLVEGEGGNYPSGRQCVVEINLAQRRFNEYVDEFNLRGQVEKSPTMRSLISELVDLDIQEYRINIILSGATGDSDGTYLMEQVFGSNPKTGDDIEQVQEHPILKEKDRVHKKRMEILKALAATPRDKVWIASVLKKGAEETALSQTVKLLEKFAKLDDSKSNGD